MVSVDPKTVTLTPLARASRSNTRFVKAGETAGGQVVFEDSLDLFVDLPVTADASARLTGTAAADVCDGWEFGFVQTALLDQCKALYRGAAEADGSALFDFGGAFLKPAEVVEFYSRGRPWLVTTVQAPELCYDTPVLGGDNWYPSRTVRPSGACGPSGQLVSLSAAAGTGFSDAPYHTYPVSVKNPRAKWAENRLVEVFQRFAFMTQFAAKSPTAATPAPLATFFWSVEWSIVWNAGTGTWGSNERYVALSGVVPHLPRLDGLAFDAQWWKVVPVARQAGVDVSIGGGSIGGGRYGSRSCLDRAVAADTAAFRNLLNYSPSASEDYLPLSL
jgi:hypothetical protein